jgi:hypothetical protein
MTVATVLGDTWRFGVTLLVLGIVTVFWYFVVSRLTPFPGTTGGDDHGGASKEEEEEERYPRIRKFTVASDIVLFVWIVLEGAIVIPFMFIKYGMH